MNGDIDQDAKKINSIKLQKPKSMSPKPKVDDLQEEKCDEQSANIFLANIIYAFHVAVIIFILLAPFLILSAGVQILFWSLSLSFFIRIPGVKIERSEPIVFLTIFASWPEHTTPILFSLAIFFENEIENCLIFIFLNSVVACSSRSLRCSKLIKSVLLNKYIT